MVATSSRRSGKRKQPKTEEQSAMINTSKMNWSDYKDFCFEHAADNGLVYRGQAHNEWGLLPAFNRLPEENRREKNFDQILSETAKGISNEIGYQLDPRKENEKHIISSILQHYGFPTPLLDWSKSPYIAAYFAFSNHAFQEPNSDYVSIWVLPAEYTKDFIEEKTGETVYKIIEPDGIHNLRLKSQEGIFTYVEKHGSLSDSIASHIRYLNHPGLLQKIDIPVAETRKVLDDLRIMGIHAGSMFQGLEGVCNFYKEKLLMERTLLTGPTEKQFIAKLVERLKNDPR